jgi:hypothetical protein
MTSRLGERMTLDDFLARGWLWMTSYGRCLDEDAFEFAGGAGCLDEDAFEFAGGAMP